MTFDDLRELLLMRARVPIEMDGYVLQVHDVELAPSEHAENGVQLWYFAHYADNES